MKYKSRAISLTYIKQGDSSIICRILTEERGLQSFIVKGVRSRKSKKNLSYFEPLKLLNIDAKFNAKQSLQYIGEITILDRFSHMTNKMHKSFIAFFIAEVSSKVLQENEQNKTVFNFIWNTALRLYNLKKIDPNFSIKYLLELSKFLGFYPSSSNVNKSFFELESGEFKDEIKPLKTYFNSQESSYLKAFLNSEEIIIPKTKKPGFLKSILIYYKIHHYNLDGVKSHLVIETLGK